MLQPAVSYSDGIPSLCDIVKSCGKHVQQKLNIAMQGMIRGQQSIDPMRI